MLLERLARRVRELVERLDRTALRSVSARLAEFLSARADARGRGVIALGMTQQQLAEELGTVREVIVRELHALRTAGLVRSHWRRTARDRGHHRVACARRRMEP